MYIHSNIAPYTPNTVNNGSPKQANQTTNNGFFTTPGRSVSGRLVRNVSPSFSDVWSQPRLFYNSLVPAEQQFLINAIRFETSHITSDVIKSNVLTQLNRVSHDIAVRVASALGMSAPAPDSTYYHNNKTSGVGVYGMPLKKLDGLTVGYLTTVNGSSSSSLRDSLSSSKVALVVVAERLANGVDMTYSAADATGFDAIVVDANADSLLTSTKVGNGTSTLYPAGRPMQILLDAYRFGKPVAADSKVLAAAKIASGQGVYGVGSSVAKDILAGLKTFKFLNRFPIDS